MQNHSGHICPCGCGSSLRRYNEQRPLVCYAVWRQVPQAARAALMLPGAGFSQRRAAARRVFEIARAIKRARV